MSAKKTAKTSKPGRPATGVTKTKPSLTLDKKLVKRGKRKAFEESMSFSAWIEKAIANQLDNVEPAVVSGQG